MDKWQDIEHQKSIVAAGLIGACEVLLKAGHIPSYAEPLVRLRVDDWKRLADEQRSLHEHADYAEAALRG